MSEKTKKGLKTAYLSVLSALLLCVCVLFIISCVNIYQMERVNIGGTSYLFTRERISEAFSKISIPVYVTAAFVLLGIPVEIFLCEPKKLKAESDGIRALGLLYAKLDKSKARPESLSVIEREEKKRRILSATAFSLLALGSVVALVIALNGDSYSKTEINASVLKMLLIILGCVLPAVVMFVANVFIFKSSIARETEVIRSEISGGALLRKPSEEEAVGGFFARITSFFRKNEKTVKTVITSVILVLSALFIILGIFNGGFDDVIAKATKICQECIGMG